MSDLFTLTPEPPRRKPVRFESSDKTCQKVLFCGLSDLPGQQNLFELDGHHEEGVSDEAN